MFLTGVAGDPTLRMSIGVNRRGNDDWDMEEVSTTCKLGWVCVVVVVGTFLGLGLFLGRPCLRHGCLGGVTMGAGVVLVPGGWAINPAGAGANIGGADGP